MGEGPRLDAKILHLGDLSVDPGRREVIAAGQVLELRTQEFELLHLLAGQPGRVFTREQLLQEAWGFDFYGQTRTVDVHIAHLRKKLAACRARIETVTGIGYKLVSS
jgi:DNA-binding response OmpR family regulator